MIVFERVFILAFLAIAIMLAVDIRDDVNHGADLLHVGMELSALFVSAGVIGAYLFQFIKKLFAERDAITSQVRNLSADRDRWKEQSERYLTGLGQAIDAQFQSWHLSESEKEIGLLILKGFTHKEIAGYRKTSEQTVRQQAMSVYNKAGLENKAQLAAFFLEDLMLPHQQPQGGSEN